MTVVEYVEIGYLVLINIIAFILYAQEAQPKIRFSSFILILFPVIGGSLGAVVANTIFNTEYRESRAILHKTLAYLPPIMLIIHFVMLVGYIGIGNIFSIIWNYMYTKAGVIGCILLIINIITFILVIIRKLSYYFTRYNNMIIPDFILVPIIILGGSLGGCFAKILFNFGEDWSCNSTMKVENFVYNIGMYIICAIHIVLFIFIF